MAGGIAAHQGAGAPYWWGAGVLLLSITVLLVGRRQLAGLDARLEETPVEEAAVLTAADA